MDVAARSRVASACCAVLLLLGGCVPPGGDEDAGVDLADAAVDAGPDAGTLQLSAPGPLVWYLNAPNAHALSASGGSPPYSWQLTDRPAALDWLTLETSGTLTGTAKVLSDAGVVHIGVRASDTSGLFGAATFAVDVRACSDGTTIPCAAGAQGEICYEGTQTCAGGRFSECGGLVEPSDLFFACGPECGSCDLERATACVGGKCACGSGPGCVEGDTCCANDAGTSRYCATLSGDVANCGACGNVCTPGPGDPDASVATCAASTCGSQCADGANACDGACRWRTNMEHCGGCNQLCPLNPPNTVGTANCETGSCAAACAQHYANCNANMASDGCEARLPTSEEHCGECGRACTDKKNTCVEGACGQPCNGAPAEGGFYCFGTQSCAKCQVWDPDTGGYISVDCCR